MSGQPHLSRTTSGRETVKGFFCSQQSSALQAWLHYFDVNGNHRIDFDEFSVGMRALKYEGNLITLWKEIDTDGSGELTLDEIDRESASIWRQFRAWAALRFESEVDMVSKLGDGRSITQQHFLQRVPLMGWTGQLETLLFGCMDTQGVGVITPANLKWFDEERKRQKRKLRAKAAAANNAERRMKEKLQSAQALTDFKEFLKRRHGCLYRAWRREIDPKGTLAVSQKDLFKACRLAGWHGDVRALWKGLDADDSGVTTLAEIDASSARYIALYKHWTDQEFGSAFAAFEAIQRLDSLKVKKSEFLIFAQRFSYPGNRAEVLKIFSFLDFEGKRHMLQSDNAFLQSWRPPTWLIAQPNQQAADDLKAILIRKYRHLVKAWRVAMDRDGSNRLSWGEFEDGCKRVGFKGDVPGAWLTLDEDLSGAITLGELDPKGYKALMDLKMWADAEFGGVRSAFRVLDVDGSGSLTFLEFKRACHDYGFSGDCLKLFLSLDCDSRGEISFSEVAFLDQWVPDNFQPPMSAEETKQTQSSVSLSSTNSSYPTGPSISQVAEVASWFALQRRARMDNNPNLRSQHEYSPWMIPENATVKAQEQEGSPSNEKRQMGQKTISRQPLGSLSTDAWSLGRQTNVVSGREASPMTLTWPLHNKASKRDPGATRHDTRGLTWPQEKEESLWTVLPPSGSSKKESAMSPRGFFSSPYANVPKYNGTPRTKKTSIKGRGVEPQKLYSVHF